MTTPVAPSSADGPRLRLRGADRQQVVPVPAYVDALLPDDHLARLLWQASDHLDLTAFRARLRVREGGPGRAAADPQVLLVLWLYATTQGVTSARALTRLCVAHLAYIWICGGVSMNYHSLSDFRVQHAAALDDLMTQVLGRLHQAGLIAFDHVAQDGVRVRASAGTGSFHRQPTLEASLVQARAVLAAVQTAPPSPEGAPPSARQQAARARAARARVARVEAALAGMSAARAAKASPEQDRARVSQTDAEARVMKMPDNGYRPAYNVQLAADTAQQVIVGVAVTSSGSDMGQAPGMVAQVKRRLGALPAAWLMDGGFVSQAALQAVTHQGVTVLAPVKTPKGDRAPYQPLPEDPAVIAAWRIRMGTEAAQTTYRRRAATIECVNAQARSVYALTQVRVRGQAKVTCVVLWMALAHNLRRWVQHAPAVAA